LSSPTLFVARVLVSVVPPVISFALASFPSIIAFITLGEGQLMLVSLACHFVSSVGIHTNKAARSRMPMATPHTCGAEKYTRMGAILTVSGKRGTDHAPMGPFVGMRAFICAL
jgi:hypothetical protein